MALQNAAELTFFFFFFTAKFSQPIITCQPDQEGRALSCITVHQVATPKVPSNGLIGLVQTGPEVQRMRLFR